MFDRCCSPGVDLPEYLDLALAEPAVGAPTEAPPGFFDDSLEFLTEANYGTDYNTLFDPAAEAAEG